MLNGPFTTLRLPGPFARRRGGGFNPASLFANGEQGAFYDPSDLRTLFQDEAGTTPVTDPGQTVGLMLDKSGNDNHATQPAAESRPVYQAGGGLHWLEFDGVDDVLETKSIPSIADPVTGFSMIFGTQRQDDEAFRVSQYNTDDRRVFSSVVSGSFSSIYAFSVQLPSAYAAGREVTIDPGSMPHIATMRWGGADEFNKVRINGGSYAVSSDTTPEFPSVNEKIEIGAYNDSAQNSPGKLFSLVIIGRDMTESEIPRVEQWSARKTGISI